jgi:hypothetical protein
MAARGAGAAVGDALADMNYRVEESDAVAVASRKKRWPSTRREFAATGEGYRNSAPSDKANSQLGPTRQA